MRKYLKSVSVLGLDGLPRSMLEAAIQQGFLPYYGKLYKDAVVRDIYCIPPVTPASWPSIMSGVNPGKHGLFSFFNVVKGEWKKELVSTYDLEHPRIHEMLSYAGKKSFIVNPIPDYPIIPVKNTTIISNMFFTPRPTSYPSNAIEKYFPEYDIQKLYSAKGCEAKRVMDEYIGKFIGAVEKAVSEDYDLYWINLNFPDPVLHKCPKVLNDISMLSSTSRKIDKIIKLLSEQTDAFIIVSDHGFEQYRWYVNINDILYSEGYAVPSQQETEQIMKEDIMRRKKIKLKK